MGMSFSTSIVLSYKLYMESKRDIVNFEKYFNEEVQVERKPLIEMYDKFIL